MDLSGSSCKQLLNKPLPNHVQVLRYPADLPERWLRAVQVGDAPLDHLALLVRQTNAFFVACSVIRINNVSTAEGQIIKRTLQLVLLQSRCCF